MAARGSVYGGHGLVLRRHHPLEHVLLGDGAQRQGDEGAEEGEDGGDVPGRPELELAVFSRMGNDGPIAALHLARHHVGDDEQADDDGDHLDEGDNGNRHHAAEHRVGHDADEAEHHAQLEADHVHGHDVDDKAERHDLRGDPAQIADADGDGDHEFHRRAEAHPVEITDGVELHAVDADGEEQAHEDKAEARADGVGDDATEIFFHEGGGNAEDGFRAEECHEDCGGDDVERQGPACQNEITGSLNSARGIDADADGNGQVEADEKGHGHYG